MLLIIAVAHVTSFWLTRIIDKFASISESELVSAESRQSSSEVFVIDASIEDQDKPNTLFETWSFESLSNSSGIFVTDANVEGKVSSNMSARAQSLESPKSYFEVSTTTTNREEKDKSDLQPRLSTVTTLNIGSKILGTAVKNEERGKANIEISRTKRTFIRGRKMKLKSFLANPFHERKKEQDRDLESIRFILYA